MTKRRYFREALVGAYTQALVPRDFLAVCCGRSHVTHTRPGAWFWVLREARRIAAEDYRLHRLLDQGLGR